MKPGLRRSVVKGYGHAAAMASGPRILALLPALILVGFWLGGEGLLIGTALGLPLILAAAGRFGPDGKGAARDGDDLRHPHDRRDLQNRIGSALAQARKQARRTGCILIEIDDFDETLDRFGKTAAEEVITRTGSRLKAALRSRDQVFRMGRGRIGLVIAPVRELDMEIGLQLANRIQRATEEPIAIGGTTIYVSVSIGVSLDIQFDVPDAATLAVATLRALAEARRFAPSAIRAYSPDLKPLPACPNIVTDEVARAFRDREIRPWYQPQICTDTGRVSGFEALARWIHPTKGTIPPADFLTTIEQAGRIEMLGDVVLDHALTTLCGWDEAGFGIPHVGVNFSPQELRNPKLADRIAWQLDRFGLAPNRLAVEILETVVATSPDDTIVRNISNLSDLGCQIDLDDFGTGHASISSIRRFAVKRLKIDRSFVIKLDRDPEQQRMVSAILLMAERLELETLAEGVETAGEHAMLAQLGCGHVQGFGIGRPMPRKDTAAWIVAHEARLAAPPDLSHRQA